jgi:hypothetical protein
VLLAAADRVASHVADLMSFSASDEGSNIVGLWPKGIAQKVESLSDGKRSALFVRK